MIIELSYQEQARVLIETGRGLFSRCCLVGEGLRRILCEMIGMVSSIKREQERNIARALILDANYFRSEGNYQMAARFIGGAEELLRKYGKDERKR